MALKLKTGKTEMNVANAMKVIEADIIKKGAEISRLNEELRTLKLYQWKNKEYESIVKKFEMWCELEIGQTEYNSRLDTQYVCRDTKAFSPPLTTFDLFEPWSQPVYCEKYQTLHIESVAHDVLSGYYTLMKGPNDCDSRDGQVTTEHYEEWMKWLMAVEYKSMIYDW